MSVSFVPARTAQKILSENCLKDLSDWNINIFAAYLNLPVKRENLGRNTGALLRKGKTGIISVNSNICVDSGRYRFTVAHEIGHFYLHSKTRLAFICTDEMFYEWFNKYEKEREANAFAAELLMPEDELRSLVEFKNPTRNLIESCAKHFGTSLTSMCVRLVKLASQRMIVYLIENGKLIWSDKSDQVGYQSVLPIGAKVSELSCAGDYFLSGEEEYDSPVMSSEVWLNKTDDWNDEIKETSFYFRDRVLSIIWEP